MGEKQGVINRDLNAAQRVSLALKLRSQGVKYDDIAKMCSYANAGAAHKAVKRELQRVVVLGVDELRLEQLNKLETLEVECWKLIQDKENKSGKLYAVDRVLAIIERRCKLMGLDAKPEDMPANVVVVREIPANYLEATKDG